MKLHYMPSGKHNLGNGPTLNQSSVSAGVEHDPATGEITLTVYDGTDYKRGRLWTKLVLTHDHSVKSLEHGDLAGRIGLAQAR